MVTQNLRVLITLVSISILNILSLITYLKGDSHNRRSCPTESVELFDSGIEIWCLGVDNLLNRRHFIGVISPLELGT